MNTGIQDAWNLGWKLALVQKCFAREDLLNSFEQERMPVERRVLKMTEFTQQMITAEHPANRFLRDTFLPLLSETKIFQSQATKTISETAVQYRDSPAVEDHYIPRGPRACDFAPNATVLRPAKKDRIRIASLLGKEHVLLAIDGLSSGQDVFEKLQPTFDLVKARYGQIVRFYLVSTEEQYSLGANLLIDGDRQLAQNYGLSALYLIRPDGYIAFRCKAEEPELLSSYLEKNFVPI
jgi:FAD binding domain